MSARQEPRPGAMRILLPFAIVVRSRATSAVLCAGLVVLTSLLALRSGTNLRYVDERHYHQLAVRLGEGLGFSTGQGLPTAFRPPGYPFFLAGVYRLWESPLAGKLANALLLGGLAWMLGSLVARSAPHGRALPPLLILLYPVLPYTATTLYPQVLGAVLLVGVVTLLTQPALSPGNVVLAGILLGLLCLAIPAFLMILPLLAAFLFFRLLPRLSSAAALSLLLVVLTLATIGPWTARNALRFGDTILISTNSGRNLYLGNHGSAGPTDGVNVAIPEADKPDPSWSEARADRHYRGLALRWLRTNPYAAARLYLRKVAAYFHFRNRLFATGESSRVRDALLFATYYPLLFAGGLRLILRKRFPMSGEERLYALLYVGNAFLSAVFFPRIRFRLPFDALLIASVATFAGRLLAPSVSAASPGRR